jgi:hypothetical protein
MMKNIAINIDFDGTCVTHSFPEIGKEIGAIPVLKRLVEEGHHLILFTMRSNMITFKPIDGDLVPDTKGHFLNDAIRWFMDNDIPLYGVQTNPTQSTWTESPKSYAPLMIDDSAIGCPLKMDETLSPKPFVDWVKVEQLLEEHGILSKKEDGNNSN